MLYIVATPIGNLEDISARGLQTLKDVDLIAAEDTRHSKKLLQKYDIKTQLISYHSHSTDRKVNALVSEMQSGKSIALISDAGTPGISDPAWSLIKATREAELNIIPIPGAAAFLAALMGSGLPMNQFTYLGFVPAKKGRKTLFESLLEETRTTILYESPHRILKTLGLMLDVLGPDRRIVVARELTKLHEEFHRGTTQEIYEEFKASPRKGEMVILVAPANF
ncbi:16S rRNA (cytidine(1402)-2'-O)-methyltransferase [Candidatus Peregrinibacteria bacterium]|jgi:16S rRNA (cytidine1402-2'-O)-methyltransferase|nr:16S rRNA (cytidine(1402)-2'-O)-methyltransferase [Candidatus Peregrinibacteria bacterium]MBT4631424.1 16S rRNA (cytidine(1402)-2'-O)-methyltransferase [Candidatus Peregrinibacteria bacterium]MBT5516933.1 16S rRNA (cytidine(1402)-2'-O)-methyltransferase [Candidatus Peregrinibacteria bacterium]MBT5823991.1 16S rRNA (cytidine(1402)-2'-O)-methyltransferase [Candidatus Peregrinibacteria bacterium]